MSDRKPWEETWRASSNVLMREDPKCGCGCGNEITIGTIHTSEHASLAAAAPEMARLLADALEAGIEWTGGRSWHDRAKDALKRAGVPLPSGVR